MVMKRFRCLSAILVACFCSLSVSAITLNGAEFTIDTLACFSPGPGATYYQLRMFRKSDHGNRLDCWLMTVDTRNPYVSVETVLANDAVIGTERPSSMAARKTTGTKIFYGGTNADFFLTSGNVGTPRGLNVINNEYAYTTTASQRRFGGVTEDMLGCLGTKVSFSGKLVLSDTTLTIKHVNYERLSDELVLYNQHNAATTLTNSYGTELLIELLPGYAWHTTTTVKARVLTKQVGVGSMAIPAGKAVLSGHGTMQTELNKLNEGDTVTIKLTLKIDGKNTNLAQSVGGDTYALIVDSGRVEQSNFWNEIHPRTAYGMNQTGDTLYFLVVDGRGVSTGCTTKVLGEIINYYGAWKAVNLDGGGSSCLYLRHFGEVNNGSDGNERAVGNGIFAVANIPEADNTIATITAYETDYSLPRFGLAKPKFLGYNRYGVLLDPDVQGITLSCDTSMGEILPDGRFFANGTQGGLLHAQLNDSVSCDLNVRLMLAAPITTRLDSLLIDSKHPYEVEINGTVGNNKIQVLSAALDWSTLNEQVATVSDEGIIIGVSNGTTKVAGSFGNYTDTILVKVEIPESRHLVWEDFRNTSDWKFASTSGFNPELHTLLGGQATAAVNFNYVIGRSPYLRMENVRAMYSLPDTIRWAFTTDAVISKVGLAVRPANSKNFQLVNYTPQNPSEQLTTSQNNIIIPVRETFGDDPAIYPLWLDYINFSVDTKTTTGAHQIVLSPIELIYNEYPAPESAIQNAAAVTHARKIMENGQLLIVRDGVRYTVLGTSATE